MPASSLDRIQWSSNEYTVNDSVSLDLSSHEVVDRRALLSTAVKIYEQQAPDDYYVYCLEIDGGSSWYVGETANLIDRVTRHLSDKNVTNIEAIEPCDSRECAREREREMSYEVAIEKECTEIYGGR
jgi:predicted GIY-YIG superfamily endonuclease